MVADLQEMQENQRVSEIRIDKSELIGNYFYRFITDRSV